jgi:hypothetical protein
MAPKFNLPKIILPLPVSEYAPGSEAVMLVWVNLPEDVRRDHGEIIRENVELKERLDRSATAAALLEVAKLPAYDAAEWRQKAGAFLGRELGEAEEIGAELKALVLDETGLETMRRSFETLLERRLAWFAMIWSQGSDPATHWTPAEVRQLKEQTAGNDPQFFGWLCSKTIAMIGEHRNQQKKISLTRP